MDLTSPIVGATMPDFTSPTYTLTSDAGLENNQKAYAVTGIGGTQAGVDSHSIETPFQVVVSRPNGYRYPNAQVNAATGYIANAPVNTSKVIVRKSAKINAFGGMGRILAEINLKVPVGAVENDAGAIQAALSALFGAVYADGSDEIYPVITTGVL